MADQDVAAAYGARAAEYLALAGGIAQMEEPDVDRIARWRDATPGRLLDAGCGPGHWTAFLGAGGRDAEGIDLTPAFVEAARAEHPGIRFSEGTMRDLPYEDASLGGVLAWYSLIHLPPADVPAVLAEFARVLAPGGGLLIGFFDGAAGEGFAHAVAPAHYWSADALGALLDAAGFDVVDGERRERLPGAASIRPHGALSAVRRP